MNFIHAVNAIALIAVAATAGMARADVSGGSVVPVKNADAASVESRDGGVIRASSPRSRGASRADSKSRIEYAGIGTEEALRQHNEAVAQLMDAPARPLECH